MAGTILSTIEHGNVTESASQARSGSPTMPGRAASTASSTSRSRTRPLSTMLSQVSTVRVHHRRGAGRRALAPAARRRSAPGRTAPGPRPVVVEALLLTPERVEVLTHRRQVEVPALRPAVALLGDRQRDHVRGGRGDHAQHPGVSSPGNATSTTEPINRSDDSETPVVRTP
ncbi:hypothetical protein NKG05_06935 [Oerskovia sp. M15]